MSKAAFPLLFGLTPSEKTDFGQNMLSEIQSIDRRQKLRGGYYTPSVIAEFLADWAIQDNQSYCLEPSAGDGEFVATAALRLGNAGKITAIELDHAEAEKVAVRGGKRTTVVNGDFFTWFRENRPDSTFDTVLGNPPFIRYQDFPEEHREPAFELMREEGLKPSRLTNAWLPFVVVATRALRPGGRLALVLPAELLQVMYASELRQYLAAKYSQLIVVTFRKLIFSGIQEEVILLLGIREDGPTAQISFVELNSTDDLRQDKVRDAEPVQVELNHAREKWIQFYLSPSELKLIREIEESEALGRLGDLAEVDVGVVTGRNEFFVLTFEQAEFHGVLPWCVPMVGRSAQIPGIELSLKAWQLLADNGGKCFLMQLGGLERTELSQSALAYIEHGERNAFHKGYKCSIRLPRWWNVPSVWRPDAFLLRQIHDAPRIIQNSAGATCTDTIHRVRVTKNVDSNWLAAASINSATFAFSEIRGRSYGGGVLELEPTEAESLPFPKPQTSNASLSIDELDKVVRNQGIETALAEVDRLVLKTAGLNESEIKSLRGIWKRLCERRRSRKRN